MANYATANLIKAQAKILAQFNQGELRVRTPEVFNSLRKNTELMIPSHNEIKNAAKRTTSEINYFARSARALGTGGEVYNHTGVGGDSNIIIPSWSVLDDKFSYDIKQANGSVFALDEMIMNEMINLNNNFSEGLEAAAANFLFSNRSGVNISTSEGTFNGTNDAFEITEGFANLLDNGYRAAQIIKSNMKINKWSGMLTVYADTIGYNKMQALASNGAGNSINTSFQFGGINWIHSVELDAKAATLLYTKGFFIAEPDMTTSVLDWMPIQNRQGFTGPDNKYGSIVHPVTGLPLALHEYSARQDGTGVNSENQSVGTQVQAFAYLSFNTAPLTVANETPLQAFALV